MKLRIGDTISKTVTFSEEDIKKFADYSGDRQPLHIDKEKAAKSLFKEPIAHGFLTIMPITCLLGMNVVDTEKQYLIIKDMRAEFNDAVRPGDSVAIDMRLVGELKRDNFLFYITCTKAGEKYPATKVFIEVKVATYQ